MNIYTLEDSLAPSSGDALSLGSDDWGITDADRVDVLVESDGVLEEEHSDVETGGSGNVAGVSNDTLNLDDLEWQGLFVLKVIAELPLSGLDGHVAWVLTEKKTIAN